MVKLYIDGMMFVIIHIIRYLDIDMMQHSSWQPKRETRTRERAQVRHDEWSFVIFVSFVILIQFIIKLKKYELTLQINYHIYINLFIFTYIHVCMYVHFTLVKVHILQCFHFVANLSIFNKRIKSIIKINANIFINYEKGQKKHTQIPMKTGWH